MLNITTPPIIDENGDVDEDKMHMFHVEDGIYKIIAKLQIVESEEFRNDEYCSCSFMEWFGRCEECKKLKLKKFLIKIKNINKNFQEGNFWYDLRVVYGIIYTDEKNKKIKLKGNDLFLRIIKKIFDDNTGDFKLLRKQIAEKENIFLTDEFNVCLNFFLSNCLKKIVFYKLK